MINFQLAGKEFVESVQCLLRDLPEKPTFMTVDFDKRECFSSDLIFSTVSIKLASGSELSLKLTETVPHKKPVQS